jgi:tight adherence protein B
MNPAINTLLSLSLFVSIVWACAPRFFLFSDALLARQRVHDNLIDATHIPPQTTAPHPQRKTLSPEFLSARGFNELARRTRAHLPPRDAIFAVTHNSSSDQWREFTASLHSHISIELALDRVARQKPASLSAQLLQASISSGSFVPLALDHAAMVMRDSQRTADEISVATAHANVTMRMLTRTPFVLITVALLVSDSFRNVISTSGMFLIFGIALMLNRIGAIWTTALIRRTQQPTASDDLIQLISILSVHVRAGSSLPSACLQLNGINDVGDSIATLLQSGHSFEESLTPLSSHSDPFGEDIASLLISAFRDGQPVLDTMTTLTTEARQHKEHITQALIRKLPSQLAVPVVLCALPSFILLIVVPLILAQLTSLSQAIPGTVS